MFSTQLLLEIIKRLELRERTQVFIPKAIYMLREEQRVGLVWLYFLIFKFSHSVLDKQV